MSLNDFLLHSDLVSRVLALMLLALSVGSWVVIAWKWRLLSRVT
jgi:biopolymer transport protein ExbB